MADDRRLMALMAVFVTFWRVCSGIRMEAVAVPKIRFRGQNASLLCQYELEDNEELFSLKWYKEETEFYRFTPPDSSRRRWEEPPDEGLVQTWDVPGIKINTKDSSPMRVELRKVIFKSSGMYRCQVTASVRSRGSYGYHNQGFTMKESINRMTVVEVPKRNPQITGSDPVRDYSVGDTLNLTCISAPSNPPSQLEWRLNGRPVDARHVIRQHLVDRHRGLFASVTGLLLQLEPRHFKPGGEIRVKCLGTIAAEFWEDDVENVYTKENNNVGGGVTATDGRGEVYDGSSRDRLVKVLKMQEASWPSSGFASRSPMGMVNLLALSLASLWRLA